MQSMDSNIVFDADAMRMSAAGITFDAIAPLIDGVVPEISSFEVAVTQSGWILEWLFDAGRRRCVMTVSQTNEGAARGLRFQLALDLAPGDSVQSLGLRFHRVGNVLRYLRNGYTSWDGSFFVELEAARPIVSADPLATIGHAMTALVGESGVVVLGFLNHDRFQTRFRFAFADGPLSLDVETLLDGVVRGQRAEMEPLLLIAGSEAESTLRQWAHHVAREARHSPRVPSRRIAGWCSWYSLYASISESLVLEHLDAAANFRATRKAELGVFQVDDGFTPEMGDWLDVKPQFPRGMRWLLDEIRARGFTPGLWIAPFMIGNRSRLFSEHPDWVVTDRTTGRPIAPMKFYGEFRWHKRSEEYYVLDVTHPQAERYIRDVFRTWARDWGCGYFKTDFMYFGSEYGPEQVRWHQSGLSRMEVWMKMARLIREEIGEALWLGCGGPIWAGIGLMDAVRTGRDIGVSWEGHYSAESLLRDQTSRNFGNGILWQSDPDCILLRERFHNLDDEQVRSLALFAGLAGGVLMTSDKLDELPEARAKLLAELASDILTHPCEFPLLGRDTLQHHIGISHLGAPKLQSKGDPVLVQRVRRTNGDVWISLLNTSGAAVERTVEWALADADERAVVSAVFGDFVFARATNGITLSLPAHATRVLSFSMDEAIARVSLLPSQEESTTTRALST
jgi:alpha-galactosidase